MPAQWLLFMGAVVLVLVIACTNVANLLMERTADRAAELSIRSALGASQARLARRLLTERLLLLSFAAALGGLLVAYCTTLLAATVEPPPLGMQAYSILVGRVLSFTLTMSLVTALLFGVLLRSTQAAFALSARGAAAGLGARGCSAKAWLACR